MPDPKLNVNVQELFREWFELRLEVAALERCLVDAGVVNEAQLRQAREATKREAQQESAALQAMLQSLQPGKKGPGSAD